MAIFENLSCYFPSLTVEQLKFNYSNVRGYAESFHKTKWLYDEITGSNRGRLLAVMPCVIGRRRISIINI